MTGSRPGTCEEKRTMQPKITTTITCVKCGGSITGGDRETLVRCPYCGVEYQLSISAVVVTPTDVGEKIRALISCVLEGNHRESAEACLELAKIRDGRVVAPVADAIEQLYATNEDYLKVQPSINALGDILKSLDVPAAAGALNDALKNRSANIRQLAAYALEKIGDPSSAGPLIEAARDPDQYARGAALEALGSQTDERIPGILMSALDEENYSIKTCALRALARLRCRAAAGKILDMFKEESITRTDNGMPWVDVRYWAAHALGQIGYEPAVGPLIKALEDDDEKVRKVAANALMYIGSAAKDESLKEKIKKAREEFEKK
jgi:HEAT repeat protein